MKGWTLTRVWEVNKKLVVSDSIEGAIALFKKYVDEPITNISAISNNGVLRDFEALIKEEQ